MKINKIYIGGIQLGFIRATFPFAQLSISRNNLRIKILFITLYDLKPNQVLRIERGRSSFGIKIITILPKRIYFGCFNPDSVIKMVYKIGFIPLAKENDIIKKTKGFPLKLFWFFLPIIFLIVGYILDIKIKYNINIIILKDNIFIILIFILITIILNLIYFSKKLQRMILRKYHSFEEIRPELFEINLISLLFWLLVIIKIIRLYL